MRTPVFTGSCPALVTPFDQNNIINYDAFGKLIDAQIEAGVDAVCVCGTTGESATMSIREHIAAVEFCVKRVNHRVKVIAGAGSNDTSAAVYLSQHAQDSGADALLHVTPYYNKASQAGLIKHYEYIADRVELPIILYNVPSRTGVSFTAETYKVLSENPKINGVKEASGNFSLLAHTRFLCGEDFYIWSGNDDQVVPMMALGAKGVISVASNIVPKVMVNMSHLCLDNDFAAASQLQIQYMDLIDALFTEVNPIPIKAAMNLLGMEAGPLRLPLCDISEKNLEVLRRAMGRAGLLREPALQAGRA
ncbi:MAG: 4-hydroxy-tetrahydrodipicolinate synthase [Oscillospiraceae bacterium]|jgi:4-hydroxy-tetrahydrodipicolinate synthase|nr:4-hydroxy-tetrahydrodipicolinate synthase [Oscillospiraceae bacterium]